MNYRLGFIGVGNMGGALARAAGRSTKQILLCDHEAEKAATLAREIGCEFGDIRSVALECQYIFLGVKPQMMAEMLSSIQRPLATRENVILVSMAAGLSIKTIRKMAGGNYKVIRIMPNLPVSVGKGEILYTTSENVSKVEVGTFLNIMKKAGQLTGILEEQIDAGCAVSGCGPAFVFKFIRALAQGGIDSGLDPETAFALAVQTVRGSAKLLESTSLSLDRLIDNVCSPGGSTIEGVNVLNDKKMEEIVGEAVQASYRRNIELGKS